MPHSEPAIKIAWDSCDRATWDAFARAAPCCALEQSWTYGDAFAQGRSTGVRRAVLQDAGGPLAMAQLLTRKFGAFVTFGQLLRGPVLLRDNISCDTLAAIMAHIRSTARKGSRQVLFWTPELEAGPGALAIMRRCGLRRIVTGYSSARVDLSAAEPALRAALHGKWRNGLKRAESAGLVIDARQDDATRAWLLDRYDALRRSRRFGGPDPAILAYAIAQAQPNDVLLLRASAAQEPVAGALFLCHGQCASYVIGWSGPEARARNAGTLLLWRGLTELKARGLRQLDLGGIDTSRAAGIARFKLGVGGATLHAGRHVHVMPQPLCRTSATLRQRRESQNRQICALACGRS